jgi:tetratricopeptide (TPR) repeat protein
MYRRTGDPERADTLAARAEREAPDTAEGWYVRSFTTLDLDSALQCARKAVEHDPSHALALRRLAHLCRETGDLDGALRCADRLVERGRSIVDWIIFKGQVLAMQGRFRAAIEAYTRAIASDPQNLGSYLHRAHAYRRVKEYARAVEDYTRRVEETGETTADAWDLYQRATPLWILGRTEEALADYRRVRVLLGEPFYSDARMFIILQEAGRGAEAAEVLSAARREVHDSWLGRIFQCLAGELSPAELVAEAADRGNSEHLCEAYYYAGEECRLSGRPEEARKWFGRCLQTGLAFDPNTAPAVPMNEYELAEWRLDQMDSAHITP